MTTSTAGLPSVGVHGDRDAAAVVGDRDRVVAVDGHLDVVAVPRERFVNRVVDDLVDKVVETTDTDVADVHGGTLADGLQALEHLDVAGPVVTSFWSPIPRRRGDGHRVRGRAWASGPRASRDVLVRGGVGTVRIRHRSGGRGDVPREGSASRDAAPNRPNLRLEAFKNVRSETASHFSNGWPSSPTCRPVTCPRSEARLKRPLQARRQRASRTHVAPIPEATNAAATHRRIRTATAWAVWATAPASRRAVLDHSLPRRPGTD